MTTGVRITIENYEVVIASVKDKVRGVIDRIFLDFAEDATTSLGSFCPGYVCVSPGAPESFHE